MKSSIKEQLKKYGISLTYLAIKLNISRPTLDSYITSYENKESLPNDKYQIIFDNLFEDDKLSEREFRSRLSSYNRMLNRESIMGMKDLDATATDFLTSLFYKMVDDINIDGHYNNVYKLIYMIVDNYRKEDAFKEIAMYFSLLNLDKDIKDLNKHDLKLMALYYKLHLQLKKEKGNSLSEINEKDIKNFTDKIEEMKKTKLLKEKENKKIKEMIQKKLSDYEVSEKELSNMTLEDFLDTL